MYKRPSVPIALYHTGSGNATGTKTTNVNKKGVSL
jgi:hypothetical protein